MGFPSFDELDPNFGGITHRLKFSNTHGNKLLQVVKQAVYVARVKSCGTWCRPDYHNVEAKIKTYTNIDHAIVDHAICLEGVEVPEDELEHLDRIIEQLDRTLSDAISGVDSMKLFVGYDGNDSGSCSFAAVADLKNSEILVTSSCVGEE